MRRPTRRQQRHRLEEEDAGTSETSRPVSRPGLGVDAYGLPVIDPTANVLLTVEMAIQRQDDLREQFQAHMQELLALRAAYDQRLNRMEMGYQERLSRQEAARIDAIRAVDVQAVSRAAEVSATQANTLAAQVAQAAEAMRVQVAAAAQAAQANLTTALEPIQTAINDLRKTQYEQQGQKSQQAAGQGQSQWIIVVVIGVVFSVVQIALHFVGK